MAIIKRAHYALQQYGEDGWIDIEVYDNTDEGKQRAFSDCDKKRAAFPGAVKWVVRVIHRQTFIEEVR